MNLWLERPLWLWWLIPVGVVALFWLWRSRRQLVRRSLSLGIQPNRRSIVQLLLGGVGSMLLLLAAAGPRWGGAADVAAAHRGDVVFLLDVSRSMLTRDALPDRLERGKELMAQLNDRLESLGGWRVGLVAFAGQPTVLAPLTFDLDFIRQRLMSLRFDDLLETRPADAVSGTRIGAAMSQGLQLLATDRIESGTIVLFSDGDDPVPDGEWATGVTLAQEQSVPICVIGLGDADKPSAIPGVDAQSKMNSGLLQEIAGRTRGQFFSAKQLDVESVVRWLQQTSAPAAETLARSRAPARPTWFLVSGLLCWLLALFPKPTKNLTIGSAALLMAAAHPTDAWVWRGNQELTNNRPAEALLWYQKAEERTPDPGLVAFNEGIALAKLNRWREAELHFRRSLSDAEGERRWQALYNLGTALIRRSAGRDRQALQDAIAALEQASAMNTDNADVKTNLQIAKDLLAQAPAESAAPEIADKSDAQQVAKSTDAKAKAALEKRLGPANKTGKSLNKADGPGGQETDQPPPPGAGNLPVIPDSDVVERITPEDLAQHLNRAAARIAAAQRDQLKSRRPTSKPSYPDW